MHQPQDQLVPAPMILLAAGCSKRMGTPKGLLTFNQTPWLIDQILRYVRTKGRTLIIVTGCHHQAYKACVEQHQANFPLKPQIIQNHHHHLGPFSSLQLALEALSPKDAGALVQPLDTPIPSSHVLCQLSLTSPYSIAKPTYKGHSGHPIYLGPEVCERIIQSPSTARLDHLIRSLPNELVHKIPTSCPDILRNFNRPADWREWLADQSQEHAMKTHSTPGQSSATVDDFSGHYRQQHNR